jgi:hypothetical protein
MSNGSFKGAKSDATPRVADLQHKHFFDTIDDFCMVLSHNKS